METLLLEAVALESKRFLSCNSGLLHNFEQFITGNGFAVFFGHVFDEFSEGILLLLEPFADEIWSLVDIGLDLLQIPGGFLAELAYFSSVFEAVE